ncbi:MAG TPA: hypothetical protein PKJ16_17585, partial [Spirochaetota bacterium]|nr:hypothetical protein [Spirochaetota bacterium]
MHGADVRFKTYQDDKSRFERSIDQAKDAAELEAWERVVEGGRDELRAAWERDADFKIAAALREEGDTPERRAALEQDRQEARAAWERDITAATDEAAGSWYARRQGITYERFDVERFFEALRDTEAIDRTQALADQVRDWDAIINPVAEEIRARWEESEEAFLNALRARANDLDDARRDAYGREVARIEQEIERMFRLERNSYIYRERNKFISELLIDQQSLKRKSADEAAGSASERIINETLKDLEKEEERIRTGEMKTPEGAGAVDFSKLGENWKEEIDRLLDAGLERWKRAQEELMNAMRNWKANAEDAYAAGDRMWREAYERLLGAQDQWRTKIDREIQEGLADWQEQQLDLRDNIDLSRDNLLAYLQSQQEQWNENSRGLREMALYGREAYRDARENELFLKDMYDRYLNSGYYEVAGYSRQCFPSDPCNNTPWGSVSIPIGNRYGSNRLWYNVWFSQNDYDPATRTVVEHYRYSWYWNDDGGPDPWWKWHYWEYEWTNSINSSTPLEKRSRFYFYATTYDDWRSTASEYANIIATAEDYIHNRNMLGQSGGPGYLVNSDGTYGLKYLMDGANIRGLENDQYLMTSAEFGYEYARRELDFRQKRLDIAEAIMQYAYPEEYSSNPYTDILGRRESAETTVSRRDAA